MDEASAAMVAEELSRRADVEVSVLDDTVAWTDGPTVPQMEKFVIGEMAPQYTYRRTLSVHAWAARAIAVHGVFTVDVSALRDMARPDWKNLTPGQRLALDVVRQAVHETPYPDRVDSSDHSEPVRDLLNAVGFDKTKLAEVLVARVVDSSLNRRSIRPQPSRSVYWNSRGYPFYCTRCGRVRQTETVMVVGGDWNQLRCGSCF